MIAGKYSIEQIESLVGLIHKLDELKRTRVGLCCLLGGWPVDDVGCLTRAQIEVELDAAVLNTFRAGTKELRTVSQVVECFQIS